MEGGGGALKIYVAELWPNATMALVAMLLEDVSYGRERLCHFGLTDADEMTSSVRP